MPFRTPTLAEQRANIPLGPVPVPEQAFCPYDDDHCPGPDGQPDPRWGVAICPDCDLDNRQRR